MHCYTVFFFSCASLVFMLLSHARYASLDTQTPTSTPNVTFPQLRRDDAPHLPDSSGKSTSRFKGSVERSRHERHFCSLLPYFLLWCATKLGTFWHSLRLSLITSSTGTFCTQTIDFSESLINCLFNELNFMC